VLFCFYQTLNPIPYTRFIIRSRLLVFLNLRTTNNLLTHNVFNKGKCTHPAFGSPLKEGIRTYRFTENGSRVLVFVEFSRTLVYLVLLVISFYFFVLPHNAQPTNAQRVLSLKSSHTQPSAALTKKPLYVVRSRLCVNTYNIQPTTDNVFRHLILPL
jgi:hypothetical protein